MKKSQNSSFYLFHFKIQNGVEYYFAEKAEFEKGIEQNMFLEYAKVHENYYGTSKAEVDKILNLGTCCILDIDVQVRTTLSILDLEKL